MPGNSDETRVRIAALRKEYQEQLPGRLRELEETWKRLAGGGWSAEAFQEFHRGVHALAGSGALFGYPGVSTSARALDLQLMPLGSGPPDPETARRVAAGLAAIKEAAVS